MESSRKRGREKREDSGDKRQRRPTVPQPEARIIVEQEKVSHLIGKGGSIVKNIIKQSGTYVKFDTPKDGSTKQVGTISGPLDGLGIAIELMAQQLGKYQTSESKMGGSLTMLVASDQIGLIVGKQGAIVRSVQSQSASRIQISSRPETSEDSQTDQEVAIFGTSQSIGAAARILLGYLYRQSFVPPTPSFASAYSAYAMAPFAFPTTASYWAPPLAQLPPPIPYSSSGDSSDVEVRFAMRPSEVSRIIGKGGTGVQSLCKQARVKILFDKQVQTAIGGPSVGPAQIGTMRGDVTNIGKALELIITTLATPMSEDSDSDRKEKNVRFILMVPSPVIGFLLGTKGARIKETKQKSGAQVNITGRSDAIWDHMTGIALQAVLLEGEGDQVVTAAQSIVNQIEESRQQRKSSRADSE